MKVLYILKHNPWGIGGGSYASYMYLKAFRNLFADATFDILLHPVCEKYVTAEEMQKCHFIFCKERNTISKWLSPITGITHRYQQQAKHLLKRNLYDYCIFDHSSIAGTLINYVPTGTKTIVINHNFEPKYFTDNNKGIKKYMLLHAVKSAEYKSFTKCSFNIFLTKEDEELFHGTYGKPIGKSATIGIFDLRNEQDISQMVSKKENVMVITGSLDNVQNTDGIIYFMNELYPLIADRCKVIIAGKNPSQTVKNAIFNHKNIELIPNPSNMNEIIACGNIFVCPARLGGGIKVRILDGLRCGLPVLAHTVSSRGYSNFISKGYFYSFDNPSEFLEKFNKLESDRLKHVYTSNEIVEFYQLNNSFLGGITKIKKLLCL